MNRSLNLLSLGLLAAALGPACEAADVENPVADLTSAIVTNGQGDPSFNTSGRQYLTSAVSHVTAVADAGGGKIAYLGTDTSVSPEQAVVNRVKADSNPDPTWAPGGHAGADRRLAADLGNTSRSTAGDLLVQQENIAGVSHAMTYVVGTFGPEETEKGFLIKLDEHGEPFHGFSGDGIIQVLPAGYTAVELTQIERDGYGRIVVGGRGWKNGPSTGAHHGTAYAIALRFDATTGALDNDYGTAGVASHLTPGYGVVTGMSIGSGRNDVVLAVHNDNLVMRFEADGSYDGDFGTPHLDYVSGVAVTPGGRIFASSTDAGVYLLRASGNRETSFGDNGLLDVRSFANETYPALVYSTALDRVILIGSTTPDNVGKHQGVMVVVRDDGTFDRSFADGSSKVVTDFLGSADDQGRAIAMQGTKIIAGFDVRRGGQNGPSSGALARYLVDTGADGEPCASSRCDGRNTCKKEYTNTLPSTICRAPVTTPPPPPPPVRGDEGQACLGAAPWCNDETHDTCDLTTNVCRARHMGDECKYGPCPDGEACVFLGYGAYQCQLPVGCEYQVRASTRSCTNVSNPHVTADGFGTSVEQARAWAEASLQQFTCEGTSSGCCEFSYSTVASTCP